MLTSAQNYPWWVQLRIQSFNTTAYDYAAPKSLEINGRNALNLLRSEVALNLKSKPKILFSHLSSFLWFGCASTECCKCTKHKIMKVLTTCQLALGWKSSKIPHSLYSGWSGGPRPTFDVQSKSDKIPNSLYGGGEGLQNHLPTFDAESKSAKIPNSLKWGGWVGWGLGPASKFWCWVQIC